MQALFDHIQPYCPLGKTAANSLRKALQETVLPRGAYLATEGSVCGHVYFLERGSLRGYYNVDGKEITHWFAFENHFVTSFFSFVTRQPGMENIQLLEETTLWALSYDSLQSLYTRHAEIERLGRIMHERYYVMLEERFMANHFKEARERYEWLVTNHPHILQRVPLGYIASYLNMSPETLSRIRAKA